MKNLLLIFPALAIFLLFSCTEKADSVVDLEEKSSAHISQVANTNPELATPEEAAPLTTMTVAEDTYDFGKQKLDGDFSHKFILTNTGKEPLVISNVKPACSCTASDWTKTAIAPGESGFVMAEYKPKAGKTGFFSKTVSVTTNTDPAIRVLKFTGEVVD